MFNQVCTQGFNYLNRFCYKVLPEGTQIIIFLLVVANLIFECIGGTEITCDLFDEYEPSSKGATTKQNHPDVSFAEGDTLYIKASAWSSSTYKYKWPYDGFQISMAYFEATIESIVRDTRYLLSFVAFELESRQSEYSRFLNLIFTAIIFIIIIRTV